MMTCSKCGKQNENNSTFCPKCGKKLNKSTSHKVILKIDYFHEHLAMRILLLSINKTIIKKNKDKKIHLNLYSELKPFKGVVVNATLTWYFQIVIISIATYITIPYLFTLTVPPPAIVGIAGPLFVFTWLFNAMTRFLYNFFNRNGLRLSDLYKIIEKYRVFASINR